MHRTCVCLRSIKFTLEQAMKAERGNRGISTLSLTSVLDVVGGQGHAPADLPPGKRFRTHCIEGSVDIRASLDG